MCSAPNVYMFVYILIGTHMVPLNIMVAVASNFFNPCRYEAFES